jgi:hypothetical protein
VSCGVAGQIADFFDDAAGDRNLAWLSCGAGAIKNLHVAN